LIKVKKNDTGKLAVINYGLRKWLLSGGPLLLNGEW